MSFRGIGAVCGIAVGVVGVGLAFFPTQGAYPSPQSSAAQIAAYYTVNASTAAAQSLGSLALFTLAMIFATGLYQGLRAGERERGEAWALLGLLGAVVLSATYTVAAALVLVLVRRAGSGADELVLALFDAQSSIYALGSAFMALYVGAFSIAAQRARAMPVWQAILGYATVGAIVWGMPEVVTRDWPLAFVGYLGGTAGFLAWTLIGGIRMLRMSRAAEAGRVRRSTA